MKIRQTVARKIADGCAKNPLAPFINTWQTAHDMDLIRSVMGERKLNYLRYSYGSWLGGKYAALFPKRTGKVVLDSNTEWTDDLADSWELQPKSIQRRWEARRSRGRLGVRCSARTWVGLRARWPIPTSGTARRTSS